MCRGNGLWEEVGFMAASDTDDVLTISARYLFHGGTARVLKAGITSLMVERIDVAT